jgi:ribA/ribD-fused uncharacterized protein
MINSFSGEYAFLSNFYPSPIEVQVDDDVILTAPTVEHYFQYMKTPSDEEGIDILMAATPGAAKRLGKKCYLRKDWEQIKDVVMYNALQKKFTDPELRAKLIATGDEFLVEGNYWNDTYWGVCDGKGQNKLGQLLMKVREECIRLESKNIAD